MKRKFGDQFQLDRNRRIQVGYADLYSLGIGIEVGTLSTFFSFENRKLGQAQLAHEDLDFSYFGDWCYQARVQFSDAYLMVSEDGHADQWSGRRTLKIAALEDSRLMDAVLRFVIKKDDVQDAFIGGVQIIHRRKNRYYQYPPGEIRLNLRSGAIMTFHPLASNLPAGFQHVVYLRDEPEKWILHIRALALAPSHYVLKGCSRWYNRPFPIFVQRILLGSRWVRSRLLYVRERISQRIPIQVNGAADLPKGSVIQLGVHWSCRHEAH